MYYILERILTSHLLADIRNTPVIVIMALQK